MSKKQTNLIFIMTLIVFLVAIGSATATNVTDNQNMVVESQTTDDITPVAEANIQKKQTKDITQTTKNTIKETSKKTTTNKETKKENNNTTITVTPDNYSRYISGRGGLMSTVSANSTLELTGNFTGKKLLINKPGMYIVGTNAILNNGNIEVPEEGKGSTITGFKIILNGTSDEFGIKNSALDVTISNNNITLIKESGKAKGIINTENNAKIINNIVYVMGADGAIDWSGMSEDSGVSTTSGIESRSGDNITITGNNVTVIRNPKSTYQQYGTIEGIEMKGNFMHVSNNYIRIDGGRFSYAINALGFKDSNITNNKIYSTGERYTCGIQVGNGASNLMIANNEINSECFNTSIFKDDNEALSFGIITTSMSGDKSDTIHMINNTMNLKATIISGFEIYKTANTEIKDNKLNLSATVYAIGIAYAHSANSTIEGNSINTTGDSRIPVNEIEEEIRPANSGIKIQQESDNLNIKNNTIYSNDAGNNATSIVIYTSNNITIKDCVLDSNTLQGADSIKLPAYKGEVGSATIENVTTSVTGKKQAVMTITIPVKTQTGTTIIITAKVVDNETKSAVNKGVVVFKINGKTISVNGTSKMYINNDGVATLRYDIGDKTAKNYRFEAVFGNNDDYDRVDATTTLTVQKADIVLPSKEFTIYSGETIKINETLKDKNGNTLVGDNKVVVKLDGKTLISTRISNGQLLLDIKIPTGTRAADHKILIIIGESSRYNKQQITYNMKVLIQDPVVNIKKITAHAGDYITIKATIKTNVTNDPVKSGKISFKINGKTIQNMAEDGNIITTPLRVTDGTATISTYIPLDWKAKNYTITLTFSGNGCVNQFRYTSDALTIVA